MDERSISSNAFQRSARIHQGDFYEGDVHQNVVYNHIILGSQHQSRQPQAHDHKNLSTLTSVISPNKSSAFQRLFTELIALLSNVFNDIKKSGLHKKSKVSLQLLGDLQALETILSLLANYIGERRSQDLEELAKRVLGKPIDSCKVTVRGLKQQIETYKGKSSLQVRIEKYQPKLSSKKAVLVEALNSQKSEMFRKGDHLRQARNSPSLPHLNFHYEGNSSLETTQNNIVNSSSGEIDPGLDAIRIIAGSPMAMSRQGQRHNCQFVGTWLVRISATDNLETERNMEGIRTPIFPDVHNVKESWGIVPGSQDEIDHFPLPKLNNTQYQDETFPFGRFGEQFVVNISLPKFLWSQMKKNGEAYTEEIYKDLDEFTLRRYTAVTVEPSSFEAAGFRLRQRLFQRNIERLLAVEITEDISSPDVANVVGKVLEDVRSLLSRSVKSWTDIVIGFFCQSSDAKPVYPRSVAEGSVLTRLGLLAEFPVRVDMDTKISTFIFGRSFPSSVRFERQQTKSPVQAHLFEFTTTLTPKFRSDVTYDITSHEIPLQCIVCIGVKSDNDKWIKALWAALKADCCFLREEEADTRAYSYKLIFKK